jgi:hypothetical protein
VLGNLAFLAVCDNQHSGAVKVKRSIHQSERGLHNPVKDLRVQGRFAAANGNGFAKSHGEGKSFVKNGLAHISSFASASKAAMSASHVAFICHLNIHKSGTSLPISYKKSTGKFIFFSATAPGASD